MLMATSKSTFQKLGLVIYLFISLLFYFMFIIFLTIYLYIWETILSGQFWVGDFILSPSSLASLAVAICLDVAIYMGVETYITYWPIFIYYYVFFLLFFDIYNYIYEKTIWVQRPISVSPNYPISRAAGFRELHGLPKRLGLDKLVRLAKLLALVKTARSRETSLSRGTV